MSAHIFMYTHLPFFFLLNFQLEMSKSHHRHMNISAVESRYKLPRLQRIYRYNVLSPRSPFHVMENSRSGYNELSLQRTFFQPPLAVRCTTTRLYVVWHGRHFYVSLNTTQTSKPYSWSSNDNLFGSRNILSTEQ